MPLSLMADGVAASAVLSRGVSGSGGGCNGGRGTIDGTHQLPFALLSPDPDPGAHSGARLRVATQRHARSTAFGVGDALPGDFVHGVHVQWPNRTSPHDCLLLHNKAKIYLIQRRVSKGLDEIVITNVRLLQDAEGAKSRAFREADDTEQQDAGGAEGECPACLDFCDCHKRRLACLDCGT